jgi:hypothetical protein
MDRYSALRVVNCGAWMTAITMLFTLPSDAASSALIADSLQ